jgi:hypothetical protein
MCSLYWLALVTADTCLQVRMCSLENVFSIYWLADTYLQVISLSLSRARAPFKHVHIYITCKGALMCVRVCLCVCVCVCVCAGKTLDKTALVYEFKFVTLANSTGSPDLDPHSPPPKHMRTPVQAVNTKRALEKVQNSLLDLCTQILFWTCVHILFWICVHEFSVEFVYTNSHKSSTCWLFSYTNSQKSSIYSDLYMYQG